MKCWQKNLRRFLIRDEQQRIREFMKVCHVTCAHPRYDARIFEKECVTLANDGYEVCLCVNDDLPSEYLSDVHIISCNYFRR